MPDARRGQQIADGRVVHIIDRALVVERSVDADAVDEGIAPSGAFGHDRRRDAVQVVVEHLSRRECVTINCDVRDGSRETLKRMVGQRIQPRPDGQARPWIGRAVVDRAGCGRSALEHTVDVNTQTRPVVRAGEMKDVPRRQCRGRDHRRASRQRSNGKQKLVDRRDRELIGRAAAEAAVRNDRFVAVAGIECRCVGPGLDRYDGRLEFGVGKHGCIARRIDVTAGKPSRRRVRRRDSRDSQRLGAAVIPVLGIEGNVVQQLRYVGHAIKSCSAIAKHDGVVADDGIVCRPNEPGRCRRAAGRNRSEQNEDGGQRRHAMRNSKHAFHLTKRSSSDFAQTLCRMPCLACAASIAPAGWEIKLRCRPLRFPGRPDRPLAAEVHRLLVSASARPGLDRPRDR